jgi:hypothetical protein
MSRSDFDNGMREMRDYESNVSKNPLQMIKDSSKEIKSLKLTHDLGGP